MSDIEVVRIREALEAQRGSEVELADLSRIEAELTRLSNRAAEYAAAVTNAETLQDENARLREDNMRLKNFGLTYPDVDEARQAELTRLEEEKEQQLTTLTSTIRTLRVQLDSAEAELTRLEEKRRDHKDELAALHEVRQKQEAELARLREKAVEDGRHYAILQVENARLHETLDIYERYVNGEMTVTELRNALKEIDG